MIGKDILQHIIESAPQHSGVYKMYDINHILIYVGKAKNIKKRLLSYTKADVNPKTTVLVQNISSIEFEITQNEEQALILEASLIKKYQPKYNILLKDDKSRVYIKISNHEFPAIIRYRGKFERKATLFGPFGYTQGCSISTHETIKYIISFVNKVFQIRSCNDTKFKTHKSCGKPCMEYQIKTCSAPCTIISKKNYTESVNNAILFLRGGYTDFYKKINQKIKNLAENQEFVEAGALKKQLIALEKLQNSHSEINFAKYTNTDVIVINTTLDRVEVFSIRNGYALGGNIFEIQKQHEKTPEETLESFLYEYYTEENKPPQEIISNHTLNITNINIVFEYLFKTTAKILYPQRGEKKNLLEFALKNLEFQSVQTANENRLFYNGMQGLQNTFQLSSIPNRVEIYDNSHTNGVFFLGIFVVATQNGFKKDQYRKFNAKYTKGGDDYGMMKEIMQRRFNINSNEKEMPDLLIIDGGIGQFNAVVQTLEALNIQIPVIAIAKGENRNAGNETFFTRTNPNGFKINTKETLYFIERLRDEAHRFAITSHRQKRDKIT